MQQNFIARHCAARPRLWISVAAAVLVTLLFPPSVVGHFTTRVLIGWNVGTCLYLLLAGFMISRSSRDTLLQRAKLEDEGEWVVLVLVMVAAVASIVAIVAELAAVKALPPPDKGAHIGLAVLTVLSSWAFTHTMFAMHYAHNYYQYQLGPAGHGGLKFPVTPKRKGNDEDKPAAGTSADDTEPDYIDFLYFSLIIGTSAQTADVSFTSKPMRRLGTVHCVLSFLFNTSVLALSINIAASLI